MAFAYTRHAQGKRVQRTVCQAGQPRPYLVQKYGLQLGGRAGQQHGPLAPCLCLEQHARRRAVGVVQLSAAHRHIRLLFVVRRHGAPPGGEKCADAGKLFPVKAQFVFKGARHRLFRKVVVRGAKPAGKHQQIAALHGKAHHAFQPGGVVAHHALKVHGDAKLCQLLRKELRVRVQNIAKQKLGAHGDDFCRQRLLPLFGAAARGPLCVLPSLTGTRPPQAFRRLPRAPIPPGRAWRPRPPLSLPAWALSWGAAG